MVSRKVYVTNCFFKQKLYLYLEIYLELVLEQDSLGLQIENTESH